MSKRASQPAAASDNTLTPRQRELIVGFMDHELPSVPQKAFEASERLLRAEDELSQPEAGIEHGRLRHEIDRLSKVITPPAKKAVLDRDAKINAVALAYFRAHGAPTNIRHFIEWLKQHAVLTRTYATGRTIPLSERVVREYLSRVFGIQGKRGRKPRAK